MSASRIDSQRQRNQQSGDVTMQHSQSRVVLNWLVTLLFVALLLLDLALLFYYTNREDEAPDFISLVGIGFVLGQVSIVGVGLVWGPTKLTFRVIVAAVCMKGLASLAVAILRWINDSPRMIHSFLAAELVMLVIPFAAARWFGVCLELSRGDLRDRQTSEGGSMTPKTAGSSMPPSRRFGCVQFTVSGLFAATIIVAWLVSSTTASSLWFILKTDLFTFTSIAITSVSSWGLVLSVRHVGIAFVSALLGCVLLSFTMGLFDGNYFNWGNELTANVANFGTTIATAGVLRVAGVRMTWPPKKVPPI